MPPPSRISSESCWVNPRVAGDDEWLERLEHTEESVVEDDEEEKIKVKGKPGKKRGSKNKSKQSSDTEMKHASESKNKKRRTVDALYNDMVGTNDVIS